VNDEQNSGTDVPPSTPAGGGAFDWLIESHQQSAPMAPLTDDTLPSTSLPSAPQPPARQPSTPQPLSFDLPNPATQPPVAAVPPPVAAAPPQFQPVQYRPVQYQPVPVLETAAATPAAEALPISLAPVQAAAPVHEPPSGLPPVGPPHEASSFAGGFALERHTEQVRSGNGPLDWGAFVLAFLAPPIGLILGIVAALTGARSRGYATSLAKAAIGIGAVLSLMLGVALVVVTKINNDNAAHAAIVASSADWCTKLKADPATLNSDTFGWPAPGDTIPASITSIKSYESKWETLAKVAPAGIRADTQKIAATAKSIAASVQSTQTLNDESNIAQLQNDVQTSGIKSWVSTYCG
jgi:hypothetical protein